MSAVPVTANSTQSQARRIAQKPNPDELRLYELQACFAAVGCELVKPSPKDWRAPLYVWFFGSTRAFNNLDQVEAFLPTVGGSMKQQTWPDAKAFETARAELALKGATLYCLNDDRGWPVLIASRGADTRKFASLDAVRAWNTVGGAA